MLTWILSQRVPCTLLSEVSRVAFGTFSKRDTERSATLTANDKRKVDLAYYPTIPKVQLSKADQKASGHGHECTKHSSKHPSLLPGVFTIFCQHGNDGC